MKKRYNILAEILDKRGNTISTGENSYTKSNPIQKNLSMKCGYSEERIYLHAELQAILRARKRTPHTMIITRKDSKGNLRNAFPCRSCQEAIKMSGLKKIIFSNDNGMEEWKP